MSRTHQVRQDILANCRAVVWFLCILVGGTAFARQLSDVGEADRQLAEYFRNETARLQGDCLNDVRTLDDWKARREVCRRQLLEMLGLDPAKNKPIIQTQASAYAGEICDSCAYFDEDENKCGVTQGDVTFDSPACRFMQYRRNA